MSGVETTEVLVERIRRGRGTTPNDEREFTVALNALAERVEARERERDAVDEDYRRDTSILEERWKNASKRHEDGMKEQDKTFRRAQMLERVLRDIREDEEVIADWPYLAHAIDAALNGAR